MYGINNSKIIGIPKNKDDTVCGCCNRDKEKKVINFSLSEFKNLHVDEKTEKKALKFFLLEFKELHNDLTKKYQKHQLEHEALDDILKHFKFNRKQATNLLLDALKN